MTERPVGRYRQLAGAVALLTALGLLAACGDDDDSAAPSATTSAATTAAAPAAATTSAGSATTAAAAVTTAAATPTTAAAPTGTPLKLVMLVDKSSPQSPGQGDMAPAVAGAWVKSVNGHGGVAGHPVQLDVKDTKGDPATGQALAGQLVGDASVLGVVLVDASGESSYAQTLSDGGLPVIGGAGYFPTVWSALPNVFGVTTTFPSVVNMQPVSAQKVGAQRVGTAVCAEVDSCAAASAIYKSAAQKLGLSFTSEVRIAASAASFTAECLQFISTDTQVIQFSASGPLGARLYDDCTQQGYHGYLAVAAGTVIPSLYAADSNIKLTGALNGFPWWVDAAPVKHFRDVMAAGGVDAAHYGAPTATATYASLELFKTAMEGAAAKLPASPTRADVLAAYGAVKDETLGGLLPQPMTFTAGQPAPKVTCFWLFTYEKGTFAGDFAPTCDSAAS
jgi:branched-chain amino acid transport system substrate-binding protein